MFLPSASFLSSSHSPLWFKITKCLLMTVHAATQRVLLVRSCCIIFFSIVHDHGHMVAMVVYIIIASILQCSGSVDTRTPESGRYSSNIVSLGVSSMATHLRMREHFRDEIEIRCRVVFLQHLHSARDTSVVVAGVRPTSGISRRDTGKGATCRTF